MRRGEFDKEKAHTQGESAGVLERRAVRRVRLLVLQLQFKQERNICWDRWGLLGIGRGSGAKGSHPLSVLTWPASELLWHQRAWF